MLRAIAAQIANCSSRSKSSLGRKRHLAYRRSFSTTYYQGIFNDFLIKIFLYKMTEMNTLTFNNFYQRQKFRTFPVIPLHNIPLFSSNISHYNPILWFVGSFIISMRSEVYPTSSLFLQRNYFHRLRYHIGLQLYIYIVNLHYKFLAAGIVNNYTMFLLK